MRWAVKSIFGQSRDPGWQDGRRERVIRAISFVPIALTGLGPHFFGPAFLGTLGGLVFLRFTESRGTR